MEVERLLTDVAERVRYGMSGGIMHDLNGHKVGKWAIVSTDAEDAAASLEIQGFALIDREGAVVTEIWPWIADANRHAEDYNDSDLANGAEEAGMEPEAYKLGTDWPIYRVRAIDMEGTAHDPDKTIQLGDRIYVYTGSK